MRALTVALAAPLLLAPECTPPPPPNPLVHGFSVSPTVVCAGDQVTVSWKTSGGVPLLYSAATADLGALADGDWAQFTLDAPEGVHTVAVSENTTFKVGSFATDAALAMSEAVAVSVVAAEGVLDARFPACAGGSWGDWAPQGDWSVSAKVQVVENTSKGAPGALGPTATFTHAGATFTVAGGSADPVPGGLPVAGVWKASRPLAAGEGCPGKVSVENPGPLLKPQDLTARVAYACTAP